jgi:galactose mutarotase-like enzyme
VHEVPLGYAVHAPLHAFHTRVPDGSICQPFDVTTIRAPDNSITAKFVSLGATLTELWVKDRSGKPLDVVLGYDDNSRLLSDPDHPVFNAIIGR